MRKFHKLCLFGLIFMVFPFCQCGVTVEQMMQAGKMVRDVCQPKFKLSDEIIDGIKEGLFPDDNNFKCYINCVMEMMQSMKKGKLNYEGSMRQIDIMLPEEYKGEYRNALNACKDSGQGIKNNCDASYAVTQCLYKNNPKFIFP